MKVLQAAFTPVHDILNIAGIVPGPIGTFADLGNAFLYSLEGNSSMASKYVVQAFVTSIAMPLGGTVIGILCGSNKAVKIMVGLGIMGAGAYSILTSGQGLLENFKELKNEFSKEDRDYLKILHYGSGVISNTAGVVYGINSMYGGFTAMFGKCFVAGTKIKTEDGEKNIEDIEVGDLVYSYNPETGEEGYKTVKQTFIKEADEIVHVTVSDTSGKDTVTIDATAGHPFYVVGYGFKYASELKIGDKLRSVSGDIYKVTGTETEHFDKPIKVYNFEVEDWHTYAVSEAGIIVHNNNTCVEAASNEQTTEQPSEPQPNTGTAQATTTQQGTAGKGGSGTVNPKDVRYMQSSIKNQTGDYTVLDNAQALKEGTLKPSDLPEIRIWKDNDGNLWTLDHRRLAAFRIAGVDEVPFRWATDEEVASQMWKMTTKTGGASIKLKLGNGKSIIIDD